MFFKSKSPVVTVIQQIYEEDLIFYVKYGEEMEF